jgi:hypothetical protein
LITQLIPSATADATTANPERTRHDDTMEKGR